MEQVDYLIVGAGLAGTALRWHLHWRNRSVVWVDEPRPNSSSRVAAGLITPITGMRLALTPDFDIYLQYATEFYQRVESEIRTPALYTRPCVRILSSIEESHRYQSRRDQMFAGMTSQPTPPLNADDFSFPHDAFQMRAGRLDVTGYLEASWKQFAKSHPCFQTHLDLQHDLVMHKDHVECPRFGVAARRLIFCHGFQAKPNPWFPEVVFNPTKGELLKLRIDGLDEDRTINSGVWITRLKGDIYQAGATYDRNRIDDIPTLEGQQELCDRLRTFLRRPFEVIEPLAAVRPIIDTSNPLYGTHAVYPQAGYFNGLGSKGSLHAPYHGFRFIEHLETQTPIDKACDLRLYKPRKQP